MAAGNVALFGQAVPDEMSTDARTSVSSEASQDESKSTEVQDDETVLDPLVQPHEVFEPSAPVLPSSHLQPRPLLIPQPEFSPQVQLPTNANSRFKESGFLGGGIGRTQIAGSGAMERVGSTNLPGSEARTRSATARVLFWIAHRVFSAWECNAAQARGSEVELEVVKHHEANHGFVLLRRRWGVERTCGWLGRFRRLARDYERRSQTLAVWHWLAALTLLLGTLALPSA